MFDWVLHGISCSVFFLSQTKHCLVDSWWTCSLSRLWVDTLSTCQLSRTLERLEHPDIPSFHKTNLDCSQNTSKWSKYKIYKRFSVIQPWAMVKIHENSEHEWEESSLRGYCSSSIWIYITCKENHRGPIVQLIEFVPLAMPKNEVSRPSPAFGSSSPLPFPGSAWQGKDQAWRK